MICGWEMVEAKLAVRKSRPAEPGFEAVSVNVSGGAFARAWRE